MEYETHGPVSEECRVAINRVASYELHVSDAYLSMACYYSEDVRMPPFAKFFAEQAELKREHAKQFLRYLRKREGVVCLPVIKRPDIDNWGSGLQALKSAVQLENILTNVLQDLKITATKDNETGLVDFVKEFIDKQTGSIAFLEYHQKLLEESLQQEGLSAKSAESAERRPVC
ncbi:hypothetical protein EGK_11227 [Macaca mulatta]|uniref:Ferritin n=1 Tax=Macaca mulatta TaxID=9544 RepID=G7MK08_MACMU|nr:hypothetical protein EGK_11227 [Macaca mulatta]